MNVWINDVRYIIDRLAVIYGEEKAENNNYRSEKVARVKMLYSKFNDFVINNPNGTSYEIKLLNVLPPSVWENKKYGK